MNVIRRLLESEGINPNLARDLLYLSDNLIQVVTYDDCAPQVAAAFSKSPGTFRIDSPNFDPFKLDPRMLNLRKDYAEALAGSIRRLRFETSKAIKRHEQARQQNPNLPVTPSTPLLRTIRFLERVLETRNTGYVKVAPPRPHANLVLADYFAACGISPAQQDVTMEPTNAEETAAASLNSASSQNTLTQC